MNYLTARFNAQRVLPKRTLRLSIKETNREKRNRPIPFILEGKLYSCSKRAGLVIIDEKTQENIIVRFEKKIEDIISISHNEMALRTDDDQMLCVSRNNHQLSLRCDTTSYCDDGGTAISDKNYSIVYLQDGSDWCSPIYCEKRK